MNHFICPVEPLLKLFVYSQSIIHFLIKHLFYDYNVETRTVWTTFCSYQVVKMLSRGLQRDLWIHMKEMQRQEKMQT